MAFVSDILTKPEYRFLYIFNCLSKIEKIRLFFFVEVWIMMPILIYSVFIFYTGLHQHFYIPLLIVITFLVFVCVAPAIWYVSLLNNSVKFQFFPRLKFTVFLLLIPTYQVILIKFILNRQKTIWIGIEIFTCGILYLIARNNIPTEYDGNLTFIFFNFGILANGVIIYRIRAFEELYLTFYRGLPITLLKRLFSYLLFYFVLLMPEFFTAFILTPTHLHYVDAINFSLCGYSLLLLMNSITFLQNFSMKDYLKILIVIFCVEYVLLLVWGLSLLYCLFFTLAITFFLKAYYRFERCV